MFKVYTKTSPENNNDNNNSNNNCYSNNNNNNDNNVIVEEARSVEALPDHVGEDLRNVLQEIGAEKQANSLDEKEVAIVMEIAEVIERNRKYKLPALRNLPKKKSLEETPKIDKVLSKFKTHSITKANELFYAGAVVTNTLRVKIDKVAGRKELMWKRRL